jgi:hypothetical protein
MGESCAQQRILHSYLPDQAMLSSASKCGTQQRHGDQPGSISVGLQAAANTRPRSSPNLQPCRNNVTAVSGTTAGFFLCGTQQWQQGMSKAMKQELCADCWLCIVNRHACRPAKCIRLLTLFCENPRAQSCQQNRPQLTGVACRCLREHQISRCMLQHRFQARPEEACSHQAHKNAVAADSRNVCKESERALLLGGLVWHACTGVRVLTCQSLKAVAASAAAATAAELDIAR